MPLLSQRRLQCFYCGSKSSQRYEYKLSKWRCEHCLADNYLDANGEITEPPPTATPTFKRSERLVQAPPRSSQSTVEGHDESPFCQTCLNNQYLITQNLANYLPDTTDPSYAEFEANLPKYKKELEQRYPPVCINCENGVSKRIRAAGAFAKADYLKRMMEKTRTIGFTRNTWTSASTIRVAGGLLWFFAIVVQTLWNGFGALADYQDDPIHQRRDDNSINVFQCIGEAGALHRVNLTCAAHVYYLAGWGVAASIASFWWNPIIRRRSIDRTTGLTEFYKLQTILVIARSGAWYVLGGDEWHSPDPSMARMIHATMLAMNFGVSLLAYCTPRITKTPPIHFHDDYEPLASSKAVETEIGASSLPSVAGFQANKIPMTVGFPFSKVGTSPAKQQYYQQELPENEELDLEDAMDIDSPQPKRDFQPASSRAAKAALQISSPFYGKIPPAPISQEHRLRNPPNKPSFQKTSSETQDKFFQNMVRSNHDAVDGTLDSSSEFHLQEPRLVIQQDNQETGLENWFSSNVFSLGDARPTSLHGEVTSNDQKSVQPELVSGVLRLAPIVLLICAIALWAIASTFMSWSSYLYQCATFTGAVVTAGRLIAVVSNPAINGSDVLLCIAELFGAGAMAYQIQQAKRLQLNIEEALGPFPIIYFAFMMAQECIIIVTAYRRGETIHKGQAVHLNQDTFPHSRERRSLPLDNGAALYQPQPSNLFSQETQSSRPSKANGQISGTGERFPKSTGIDGLNLGSSRGLLNEHTLGTTNRRNPRTLQSRTPKPWEVGGI